MTTPASRVRRLLGVTLAVCTTAGALLALAPAAGAAAPKSPTVTVSATVTDDTARVTTTVNREQKQVRSATCAADGYPVSCGFPMADGKKATSYTMVFISEPGTHTFSATITLTDGGKATASTSYEIAAPPATPQTACEALDGTFVDGLLRWECRWYKVDDDPADELFLEGFYESACESGDGWWNRSPDGEGNRLRVGCRYPTYHQAWDACAQAAVGGYSGYLDQLEIEYWSCLTGNPDPGVAQTVAGVCAAMNGVLSTTVEAGTYYYRCEPA